MKVFALDIGGTKVAWGVVNERAQVLEHGQTPVELSRGPRGLVDQVRGLADSAAARHEFKSIGISSAGPLDHERGVLLDPTNFFTDGEGWGVIDLLGPLKAQRPKWRWRIDNDAAAAALAEFRWGSGVGCENVMVITLGTGVGVGAVVGGKLVRARMGLHPEASHIPLNAWDSSVPCACGLNGCVEAYLAGSHFIQRLAKAWGEPSLSGESFIREAKEASSARVKHALEDYSDKLALALSAYAVLFAPEVVAFGGGFAPILDLISDGVTERLKRHLSRRREGFDLLPRITRSQLGDRLGVLAGAVVGLA